MPEAEGKLPLKDCKSRHFFNFVSPQQINLDVVRGGNLAG